MGDEVEMLCSDAEREAALVRLRDAAGEGRLPLEELADRIEAAYAARTRGDLGQLVADLPSERTPAAPAPASSALEARPARRRMFGIMGGDSLAGPMRLEAECRVVNIMGGADLDLNQAVLSDGEVTIRIFSLMGGSTIRVPHGVHVEHSSFSIMGGDDVEAAQEGTAPEAGAPVVRIRSINIMGGTTVQRGPRKPRRWPWQREQLDELPPSAEDGSSDR